MGVRTRALAILAGALTAVLLGTATAYALSPVQATPRFQDVAVKAAEGSEPPPSPPAGPSASPSPAPSEPPVRGNTGSCEVGEHQKEVEDLLVKIGGYGAIDADGFQSDGDCAAIRAFQTRFDIRPTSGRPGPLTAKVARRIAAFDPALCKAGAGLTICVDLTQQTVWAMRDGAVVLGPTVVRTGMGGGFQTPAGQFELTRKNNPEWSVPYKVNLLRFQHFTDGMGFHDTPSYIHDAFGSHGCVNMLAEDSKALWSMTEVGTPVHLFGRKPGT
ncbi:L,D-transpeptidase [Longispora sp. NPDC051575]|uniref:L,D-transpeptidase family protein n=1 Tax=Longispora sp. NPDC051575 TaxID=3154943 RepID=UPI00343C4B9E